jgi:signal transduction histidine kinase
MINLLGNAKFTAKGAINVSVSLLNEEENVTVEIKLFDDSGIGIPATKMDPF